MVCDTGIGSTHSETELGGPKSLLPILPTLLQGAGYI
jgi:hypothetical protein